MNEQERKEKAIREYEAEYANFSVEFERGSESISKWMEYINTE